MLRFCACFLCILWCNNHLNKGGWGLRKKSLPNGEAVLRIRHNCRMKLGGGLFSFSLLLQARCHCDTLSLRAFVIASLRSNLPVIATPCHCEPAKQSVFAPTFDWNILFLSTNPLDSFHSSFPLFKGDNLT